MKTEVCEGRRDA